MFCDRSAKHTEMWSNGIWLHDLDKIAVALGLDFGKLYLWCCEWQKCSAFLFFFALIFMPLSLVSPFCYPLGKVGHPKVTHDFSRIQCESDSVAESERDTTHTNSIWWLSKQLNWSPVNGCPSTCMSWSWIHPKLKPQVINQMLISTTN